MNTILLTSGFILSTAIISLLSKEVKFNTNVTKECLAIACSVIVILTLNI